MFSMTDIQDVQVTGIKGEPDWSFLAGSRRQSPLERRDQISGELMETRAASSANFSLSALLMYFGFFGANLALAFLALALNSCCNFF
jgi:hypothetical protein